MYYITNQALMQAIRKLHASGSHESLRNFLVLKAHGLRQNGDEIEIDTKNTTPDLRVLFGVEGLDEDRPFYNPLLNEQFKHDAARSVIQTNMKKYPDEATKTKMRWLNIRQSPTKSWLVKFSSEYPNSLGKGEAGLASKEDYQVSIHTPSFVLWMKRNASWETKPTFEELWQEVQTQLNFEPVEVDLLFTKDREFDADPFTEIEPDRQELVEFITGEEENGAKVLQPPERRAFSEIRMRRIVSGYTNMTESEKWWGPPNVETEALSILEELRTLMIIGPPGTGKTRFANEVANMLVEGDEARIHRFQFHASYTYEDFIEALQPQALPGGGVAFEPIKKRFALASEAAGEASQVVILDELNRADISKVFGEAFSLLEREYREPKYAIPYLYNSKERFWIRPDLYVIATLNDLDKTTYELDFALRRRFGQVELPPNAVQLEHIIRAAMCKDDDFIRIVRAAFIEVQQYYRLGHAYFKTVKDRDSLLTTYRRVIRPTINAYLGQYRKDDMEKVDSIMKKVIEATSWEEYQGANIEE